MPKQVRNMLGKCLNNCTHTHTDKYICNYVHTSLDELLLHTQSSTRVPKEERQVTEAFSESTAIPNSTGEILPQ